MNPDGTNRIQLRVAGPGHPSHARHAGECWFAGSEWIADRYFPDVQGLAHVSAASESGTVVPLLTDFDLALLTSPRWTPDDLSVSFLAERWVLDGNGQPLSVTEAGLYVIDVAFDAAGAVTGSIAGSLRLVMPLEPQLRVSQHGFPTRVDDGGVRQVAARVAGHSWSPGETAFVFGIQLSWPDGFPDGTHLQEIWIVDLAAAPLGAVTLLASGNGVGGPEWSPDGRRIGWINWDGTVVYDVVKGTAKTLRDTTQYGWGPTNWSPTGQYFIAYRWNKSLTTYDGVFRFAADLTGKTELAGSLCEGSGCHEIPLGWRD
jgi:dipeptidyl aminopeptidase/acylaminoacyl peptidase